MDVAASGECSTAGIKRGGRGLLSGDVADVLQEMTNLYAVGRTGCTPLVVQSVLVQTADSLPRDGLTYDSLPRVITL